MHEALRVRARAARVAIERGVLRGAALHEQLQAVPFLDRDAWIDDVLAIELPPPDVADLPRGVVPYLPCGVDEIIATVREAPVRASDELVDLGSGLGRVVILAHLLSGARARGIEIQAHLVERAVERARALSLAGVSFVHANAAESELDGSVFFLYTPCNGAMLAQVVRRLEDAALRRPIVVAAVGFELEVPWLVARSTSSRALTLYDSAV